LQKKTEKVDTKSNDCKNNNSKISCSSSSTKGNSNNNDRSQSKEKNNICYQKNNGKDNTKNYFNSMIKTKILSQTKTDDTKNRVKSNEKIK